MPALRLVTAPFHDGLEGVDRGRGPARLVAALRAAGLAQRTVIDVAAAPDSAAPEAERVFQIGRDLAGRVRAAIDSGAFPVVLAGDCNSCLGTVAGCGSDGLGVVWFDAHADFDTPDESRTGSLDGMGLALLTGHGWHGMRATIPGLTAIDAERVLLAGIRDLDGRPERSGIAVVEGCNFSPAGLLAALDVLRTRVGRVYLHIDLDALDPSEGIANQYSLPGGLTSDQLLAAIDDVFARFRVAAAAITAYNPESDEDGRVAATALRIVARLAAALPQR
jgi:arginase